MSQALKENNGSSSEPDSKGPGEDSPGSRHQGLHHGSSEPGPRSRFRLWPILITVGLVFVVVVNAIFIYIAVSGADDVVPSYQTEER